MWIKKDNELVNLDSMEYVTYNISEDDNQFELDFSRGGKEIAYLFFKNRKELEEAFNKIENGIMSGNRLLFL